MRPSLVAGQSMDLVDDDRPHAGQRLPAPLGREVQVEALGRGDQERRGVLDHRGARPRSRVACPDGDGDRGHRQAEPFCRLSDLGERALEVLLDVDCQRLERGDVHDPGTAADLLTGLVGPVCLVDSHEEAGQGLAGSGGRGYEDVGATLDERPSLGLRFGRALGKRSANQAAIAGWSSRGAGAFGMSSIQHRGSDI